MPCGRTPAMAMPWCMVYLRARLVKLFVSSESGAANISGLPSRMDPLTERKSLGRRWKNFSPIFSLMKKLELLCSDIWAIA